MKKGSMLTALLLAMVMCFSGFAVAESMPVVDDLVLTSDEQANTGTEVATLATYEQQQAVALYNALVSATTLQGFYDQLLLANEVDEAVRSLFTIDWTNALYTRVDELYALEDPEDEDALWLYEDAMAGIAWVFGADDARTFVNISGTIAAQNISSNTSWSLTGNVTVTGRVVVKSGAKLTISTPTSVARTIQRGSSYKGVMFYIESGATLEINGYGMQSDENSNKNWTNNCVIIDGKSIASAAPAIECLGKLILRDMVIRNNFSASSGGGILFGNSSKDKPVSVNGELTRTLIENCKGTAGSAVMIRSYTKGTVTMTDSVFQNCSTYESDTGGTIRTNGGVDTSLTITRCKIQNNTSHEHGGGIYWNANGSNALLKIQNSEITGNKALGSNGKGGGLFLEGTKMDLSSTVISGNTAKFGAGININSYSGGAGVNMGSNNSFNLNLGKDVVVKDNTASAGGGGVALTLYGSDPADGYTYNINISENALIENNTATTSGGGIYVEVAKGNVNLNEYNLKVNITGGTITKNVATNGNGGALCIDRKYNQKNRTLLVSMSAGTVSDNKAANGNGGSVYLSDGSMKVTGGTLDGFVDTASAKNGGGVYINKGNFEMTGGNIQNNRASVNGGAIYVSSGSFTISGGEITSNVASQNGGAAYVTGGSFTMSNGTMFGNEAVDGGAVYVVGSNASSNYFTMKNGTLSDNEASNNGGAVYVATGSAVVEDGSLTSNNAENGGAVYVSGGNFTMTSGTMTGNKTVTQASSDDGYGGAVCITSGTIQIGVKDCDSIKTKETHSVAGYTDKKHPKVENNTAIYGGALAVRGNGAVYIYCGNVVNNVANNRGTGMNVFMDGDTSIFHHYLDNSNIGTEHDHGLVTTGGTLKVYQKNSATGTELKIVFDPNRSHITTKWEGEVPEGYYLNLPYCPDSWNLAESTDTFVGWTEIPLGTEPNSLRKKDYMQVGDPTELVDQGNNTMTFYAVWAPAVSNITYKYALDDGLIAGDLSSFNSSFTAPATYRFSMTSGTVNIGVPAKAGYAFHGWRIYADSDTMSNWDADANPIDPTKLEDLKQYAAYQFDKSPAKDNVFLNTDSYLLNNNLKTLQSFGDITLVAVYEAQFGSMILKKVAPDATTAENFIFKIELTETPVAGAVFEDMYVNLKNGGSATIVEMPVGTYSITEETGWSWRYTAVDDEKTATITGPEVPVEVTFTNNKVENKWLDAEGTKPNVMAPTTTNSSGNGASY